MERKVIESVRDCPTVRRWIATVNDMYHLSDDEWEHRLRVLDDFCDTVAADPERMIKESRASRDAKNEYMRRLKRFVRERNLSPRAAHDAENVVRSFFIHNGARVFVRPYQ
jgi:hypothetical protein